MTLGGYEGLLARAIGEVKNHGRRSLAQELGRHSAQFLKARWGDRSIKGVMPLASSLQGKRYRGFSLPQILARTVSKECGWPLIGPEQSRHFPQQAQSSQGLDLAGRLRRAVPSEPAPEVPRNAGGSILLIDDVVTSGSTMMAAVETAFRLGWSPVQCFALAAVN